MSEGLSSLVQRLSEFRSALSPADQVVFDEMLKPLLTRAAGNDKTEIDLPVETLLLAMLFEEHRENASLREIIRSLQTPDEPVA